MFDVNPQSPYLAELVEAFRRRHRAISSKIKQLSIERVFEIEDGAQLEKLEVTWQRRNKTNAPVVRLFVWSDRWAWADAREGSKSGWRWEWTSEGRIVNAEAGATIVQAFEAMLDAIGLTSTQDDLARIPIKQSAVWKPFLATGPAP
jgi:hypothetical protein